MCKNVKHIFVMCNNLFYIRLFYPLALMLSLFALLLLCSGSLDELVNSEIFKRAHLPLGISLSLALLGDKTLKIVSS
jgi:hypothetical protein